MKILSWIEPQEELLLSIALSLAENVRVDGVRVATGVSKKLEVYLIVKITM